QMMARSGRIRQRPEEIEYRAYADFPPRSCGMPHRSMKERRKQEAEADLAQHRLGLLDSRVDRDAQALEHVGASDGTRDGAVAVFGDRTPRGRRDQACRRR